MLLHVDRLEARATLIWRMAIGTLHHHFALGRFDPLGIEVCHMRKLEIRLFDQRRRTEASPHHLPIGRGQQADLKIRMLIDEIGHGHHLRPGRMLLWFGMTVRTNSGIALNQI